MSYYGNTPAHLARHSAVIGEQMLAHKTGMLSSAFSKYCISLQAIFWAKKKNTKNE